MNYHYNIADTTITSILKQYHEIAKDYSKYAKKLIVRGKNQIIKIYNKRVDNGK